MLRSVLGCSGCLEKHISLKGIDCNCIVTRGGVYDEILPEPEGNPEGGA